jgi:hypothetical protein
MTLVVMASLIRTDTRHTRETKDKGVQSSSPLIGGIISAEPINSPSIAPAVQIREMTKEELEGEVDDTLHRCSLTLSREWIKLWVEYRTCGLDFFDFRLLVPQPHGSIGNSLALMVAQIHVYTKKNWNVRLGTHCTVSPSAPWQYWEGRSSRST